MSCSNRDRELLAEFVRQQLGQMLAEADDGPLKKVQDPSASAGPGAITNTEKQQGDPREKDPVFKATGDVKRFRNSFVAKQLPRFLTNLKNPKDIIQIIDSDIVGITPFGVDEKKKKDIYAKLRNFANKALDKEKSQNAEPAQGANKKAPSQTSTSSTQSTTGTTPTKLSCVL
jgi:hypothetical protein